MYFVIITNTPYYNITLIARSLFPARRLGFTSEEIPGGDIQDETLGTGQIGRRDFAHGYFAEGKPNPTSAICGHSGEGEHRFRREAERRSGAKVNSSRSEATLA